MILFSFRQNAGLFFSFLRYPFEDPKLKQSFLIPPASPRRCPLLLPVRFSSLRVLCFEFAVVLPKTVSDWASGAFGFFFFFSFFFQCVLLVFSFYFEVEVIFLIIICFGISLPSPLQQKKIPRIQVFATLSPLLLVPPDFTLSNLIIPSLSPSCSLPSLSLPSPVSPRLLVLPALMLTFPLPPLDFSSSCSYARLPLLRDFLPIKAREVGKPFHLSTPLLLPPRRAFSILRSWS